MPRVSVIVPMYNSKAYLDRCVQSLLQQTFTDYEIVLVDDCSSDDTYGAALELQRAHPGVIRVIKRESNGGQGGARNTGIEQSSSPWLVFVDSDDWVSQDHLQHLIDTADQCEADLVVSGYVRTYPRGFRRYVRQDSRLATVRDRAAQMALIPSRAWGKLYKRELFNEIRFPERLRQADLGIAAAIAAAATRLTVCDEYIYYYYQHGDSLIHRYHSDHRLENLAYLEKLIPQYQEVIEFLHIRELLGHATLNMLKHGLSIAETWADVSRRFPQWRDNPLLPYMSPSLRKYIDRVDRGKLFRVRAELFLRDLYAKARGV